jgi:hypothetical protein
MPWYIMGLFGSMVILVVGGHLKELSMPIWAWLGTMILGGSLGAVMLFLVLRANKKETGKWFDGRAGVWEVGPRSKKKGIAKKGEVK